MAFILNMTEGTFFYYQETYQNILEFLFEKQKDGTSRWNKTDKIIFVPESVPHEYIMKNYEFVYPPRN
jgi:hypothetical protein